LGVLDGTCFPLATVSMERSTVFSRLLPCSRGSQRGLASCAQSGLMSDRNCWHRCNSQRMESGFGCISMPVDRSEWRCCAWISFRPTWRASCLLEPSFLVG
jgi:hypothetical protein